VTCRRGPWPSCGSARSRSRAGAVLDEEQASLEEQLAVVGRAVRLAGGRTVTPLPLRSSDLAGYPRTEYLLSVLRPSDSGGRRNCRVHDGRDVPRQRLMEGSIAQRRRETATDRGRLAGLDTLMAITLERSLAHPAPNCDFRS
jgi:hypothetical protein